MDPFTFVWATEEPPPERSYQGGEPTVAALDSDLRFGTFTETKPKRQRGKKAAQAKRKARVTT
jgi:hypothetical protein